MSKENIGSKVLEKAVDSYKQEWTGKDVVLESEQRYAISRIGDGESEVKMNSAKRK